MTFLYESELKSLTIQCPPTAYRPTNTKAYRFVTEPVQDIENFLPLYVKTPRRVNAFEDEQKCQSMALSLYNQEDKARTRFQKLKKQIGGNVFKAIGSHLAVANITEKDGVNSEINEDGHFSNHPVLDCNYQTRFVIIGPMEGWKS